ncbi:MAG: FtsX-like permease family protein [Clostridia bacterium]|nr:FtsX-like permease family protein [Clostridia bacterium]
MSVLRRSILFLFRKHKHSITLFLLMLVMLLFAIISIVLFQTTEHTRETLRASLGGYIRINYVTIDKKSNPIDQTLVCQLSKVDGIAEGNGISTYYLYVPDLNFSIGSDKGTPFEHVPRFIANDRTELNENFYYRSFVLVDGRHIQPSDQNCAVISDVLAQKNHLTVGSTFAAERNKYVDADLGDQSVSYLYEVVGIFTVKEPVSTNALSQTRDYAENFIFTDHIVPSTFRTSLTGIYYYSDGALFTLHDPEKLDAISTAFQETESVDWSQYTIQINDAAYQQAASVLHVMRTISLFTLIITIVFSFLFLSLNISLWIKKRKHEIGILFSLGLSKAKIWLQLQFETMLIMLLALLLAVALSRPFLVLTNRFIIHPVSQSYQSSEQNFDPTKTVELTAAPPPYEMEPVESVSSGELIALATGSVIIVVFSVTFSFLPVLLLHPRRILSQVD